MARAERQYVRVYHDDLMSDYPDVYASDPALSTFVRLLVVADKMWPTVPELPRSLSRRALAILTVPNAKGNRLVELLLPHGYRIRGHATERIKRQESARNAAALRWEGERNAAGNADAPAEAMPSRAEPRQDEDSPPPQVGRRKDGTNPRAKGTNPRANGTSPRQVKAAEKRAGFPESFEEILIRKHREASS